jgi:hypothetical protein
VATIPAQKLLYRLGRNIKLEYSQLLLTLAYYLEGIMDAARLMRRGSRCRLLIAGRRC